MQSKWIITKETKNASCTGIPKLLFKNKYDGADKRHIGEYNCYHKIFSIVLGVSKPEYTDKQLNDIRESNLSGFDFEGKHYTMYERNAVTKANRT